MDGAWARARRSGRRDRPRGGCGSPHPAPGQQHADEVGRARWRPSELLSHAEVVAVGPVLGHPAHRSPRGPRHRARPPSVSGHPSPGRTVSASGRAVIDTFAGRYSSTGPVAGATCQACTNGAHNRPWSACTSSPAGKRTASRRVCAAMSADRVQRCRPKIADRTVAEALLDSACTRAAAGRSCADRCGPPAGCSSRSPARASARWCMGRSE
jgi:hypothetical protein